MESTYCWWDEGVLCSETFNGIRCNTTKVRVILVSKQTGNSVPDPRVSKVLYTWSFPWDLAISSLCWRTVSWQRRQAVQGTSADRRTDSGFKSHYVLEKDLSLDEGVIQTKNRLGFKQYLKDKPMKWGIKTYMLCESKSGYVYNLEVYTGKSTNDTDTSYVNDPEIGATGNVVYRLVHGLENQGFTVYMDRFYTSPTLFKFLSDSGIDACGTCTTNRKHFPVQIIRKQKELRRGESVYVACENLSAVTWMDRRPIYFMSTCHDPSEMTVVKRREKSGESKEMPCPIVAASCNRNMGGCDRNHQMARLHRSRRHYRWPRRLVMKCMLWMAYNAYIIESCLRSPQQQGRRCRTFLNFCDDLIIQLIATFTSPAANRGRSPCDSVSRLQNVGCHFPERPRGATRNNTCVVCREKFKRYARENPSTPRAQNPYSMTKTVFQCSECLQFICIRDCSTCWRDYHTKKEFWR